MKKDSQSPHIEILAQHIVPYADSRSLGRQAVTAEINIFKDSSLQGLEQDQDNITKLLAVEKERFLGLVSDGGRAREAHRLNETFNMWCNQDESNSSGMWLMSALSQPETQDTTTPGGSFDFMNAMVDKKPDGAVQLRISDELFMNFLQWHNYNLSRTQRELDQRTPEIIQRFKDKVQLAISQGKLPEHALQNTSYLDSVQFIVRDQLDWSAALEEDRVISGETLDMPSRLRHIDPQKRTNIPTTRIVRLDALVGTQAESMRITHELAHVLTGAPSGEDTNPYDGQVEEEYAGSVVEGMTEYVAAIIEGRDPEAGFLVDTPGLFYPRERLMLDVLANSGRQKVPPELFLAAYFDGWEGERRDLLDRELRWSFPGALGNIIEASNKMPTNQFMATGSNTTKLSGPVASEKAMREVLGLHDIDKTKE